jgi:AraC-like DNA-binding protein
MKSKNIAEGSFSEILIEDGFFVLKIQNDTPQIQKVTRDINSSFIQFHFCLKGGSKFIFNEGHYALDVSEENSLLLYNTQIDLPLNLELPPNSWLVSVVMTIRKFHSLFSKEANHIHFLSDENINRKYYNDDAIKPSVLIVLQQIINSNVNSSIKELFIKGKIYELLSLHFQKKDTKNADFCPFLIDEENVLKIRKAKDIIISRMSEPPSLQELSTEIGLSLKKLKEGFKQIYGDTVYGFLLDYKMEHARRLLESNKHNVNEVGSKIGYSTSSHFIAAFKKKFGTTPKKYVSSLQNS